MADASGRVASGHVVVCGLNNLGLRITEQLQASGVAAVVVDDRDAPALRRRLERWGVRLVAESAHEAEALHDADVATALAVVACHDTDLDNLETALLAAEIAPDVQLVVSVHNAQLGDQLRQALGRVRVLNLAQLAGPGFVAACVRSDVVHAFTMSDWADAEVFAVIEETVTAAGAFRDHYGDLTPISLRRPDERLAEVCPPRDVPLRPGDQLTLLGRLSEVDGRGGRTVAGLHDARLFAELADGDTATRDLALQVSRRGLRVRGRELVATVRSELDRPFRWALGVVVSIMTISTVVLALAYTDHNAAAPPDFGPLDALYLTVETMVTVGYGDFNFGAADHWLQAFGIGLMLCGALSIAVVYAFITNVIISRRLERALGRGRAGAVRGHVVLCGLGSVGVATMEGLLRTGRQVVVIERDEDNRYLPVARERGVPVVVGDATVRTTLLEAGLAHAVTVAALTSDGVANLETVLSAREAHGELLDARATREAARRAARQAGGRAYERRPRQREQRQPDAALRVVLRIFDSTMADEVERRFGIHTARSATVLATPYFVGAALGYDVISTFYVQRTPFLVARVTVRADGGLVGPTLRELSTGARVLAVTTSAGSQATEPDYRPGRDTRLRPGDELLVVGPVTQIVEMVRRNQSVDASSLPQRA